MARTNFRKIEKGLWAAFLISLPVTNFPYFPSALGGSKVSVRPLLLYPLIMLILFVLPSIWKRKLPKTWLPFFLFIIAGLISSLLPLFSGVISHLSEITLASRLFRSIVTLLLGASIFIIVSIVPRNEEDLDFTLRWLYIGLIVTLFWATLQLIYVLHLIPNWYRVLKPIQNFFTLTRGNKKRLIGLTQEPSWFADQLSVLYLPWIYAAVLRGKTVFKRINKWLTVETLLLVWVGIILVFTLSRSGYVTAAVVLVAGFILFRPRQMIFDEQKHPSGFLNGVSSRERKQPDWVRYLLGFGLIAALLGVSIFLAGRENSYISRMWGYWLGWSTEYEAIGSKSLWGYIRYVGFGPRIVYWQTAFEIFKSHPLLGVGLGNYTFYFQDYIPSQQLGYMPEVLKILVPDKPSIITPKNYFARLLAEMGIVGTATFISFLIVLFGQGLYNWFSKYEKERYWGAAAILGIIAFLVNTFSFDSFAIPNPWIVFGIISAAYGIYSKSEQKVEIET